MNLSPPEIHALFINSQRYCLGRSGYAISEYCEILKVKWPDIPQNTRNILIRDLKLEIDSDRPLGHDCDRREWIRLLDFMRDCQKEAPRISDLPRSAYCVFRYCPDPVSSESANFGVAVFSGIEIRFKFTDDWDRLKSFGRGEDIQFLQDFAGRCLEDPIKMFAKPVNVEWSETMRLIRLRWLNSIQVSESSGSLVSIDECVDEIARIFLEHQNLDRDDSL